MVIKTGLQLLKENQQSEQNKKAFCIALNLVIDDEAQAPIDYNGLIIKLNKTPFWTDSKNEANIRKIIAQEKAHKVTLSEMRESICK